MHRLICKVCVSGVTLYITVSEAPKVAPPPKKYQSYNSNYKTDEEKKEEVPPVYRIDV